MASYQIPQFLDSGDKILGPLNMRQFGYALGGFMLTAILYTLLQEVIPGIQIYAIIPIFPVIAIAAYLAIGRYNGRDSEIYVLKFIIYNAKPKQMVYTRVPDVTDLNQKMSEWTSEKILKRWDDELKMKDAIKNNQYLTFDKADSEEKAKKVRNLGNIIDLSRTNTMTRLYEGEASIASKEALLDNIKRAREGK